MSKQDRLKYMALNALVRHDEFKYADPDNYIFASLSQPPIRVLDKHGTDDEFHFTLDVCANEENHKCERYFSKADDGLKMDWGGRDYMVQPTVWPRDRQVGGKVRFAQWLGSYALACAHRHTLVSRLHLQEVRDQIYQRPPQVWRQQELGTVSEYGSYF